MKKQIKPPAIVSDDPAQKISYSDLVGFQVSAEEVIFHFGLRKRENPNEATGVAKIYVSPQHAKRIAQVLVKNLHRYEKLFGEIKTDIEDRLTPEGLEEFKEILTDDSQE